MGEVKNLCRVILRSDGSVHIAFRDIRSIQATPANLIELFSDPIEFIEVISKTYKETTFEINRKRVSLEEVLGLSLAVVNSDKQIVCDFPELFQSLFSTAMDEKGRTTPLDMKSFELETMLSDEKSFLLRYYLEFTSTFRAMPTIKKNIKLRNEVQLSIMREILNTFFDEELPTPSPVVTVNEKIQQAESEQLLQSTSSSHEENMVSVVDYALILGTSVQTIYKYVRKGRIRSADKDEHGQIKIDRNDRPINWDMRKGRKRKATDAPKHYKRPSVGSAADVEEHILQKKLFTAAVASYIHTFGEMDYYVKHSYHEVVWNGRPALIIDVNPEYISSATGICNRDLMKAGKAPVVPHREKEEFVFHIHHVGQRSSSPFAIIPEYDHNGKGLSAVFHQGTPNTELHGAEFEAMKMLFWKKYIDEYDKVKEFGKIPYLNPKKHSK